MTRRANGAEFRSGPAQTGLLELYTSEGCSSCPPAERWLSQLVESPRLWKDFVPVAFHVDYWDGLGWKDPYASGVFTRRQRALATRWGSDSVYTPGFAWKGREWRGWFERRDLPNEKGAAVGVLSVESKDGETWKLRFEPAEGLDASECGFEAALLGVGMGVAVKGGENSGRNLVHDFVVLASTAGSGRPMGKGFEGSLRLQRPTTATTARILGCAIWVTRKGDPIQATGGWLAGGQGK